MCYNYLKGKRVYLYYYSLINKFIKCNVLRYKYTQNKLINDFGDEVIPRKNILNITKIPCKIYVVSTYYFIFPNKIML